MSRPAYGLMVYPNVPGGIRSVVESFRSQGLLNRHQIALANSYASENVGRKFFAFVAVMLKTWRLLQRPNLAFVYVHAAMRGSFLRKAIVCRLARRRNRKTVLHLHGSEFVPFYQNLPGILRNAVRKELETATAVVCLSKSWADFVRGIAPTSRAIVIPNFVALDDETSSPSFDARCKQIVCLGRVGNRKGSFDLIKAMPAVLERFPDARLVLGGDGALHQARDLARKLGVANAVEVCGWLPAKRGRELLRRSSVYCLPSRNEGLPVSIIEAMANGCTVISTDVGGIPDLITDGVTGLVVEAGRPEQIASAIVRLLGNEPLRDRLAREAHSLFVRGFSDRAVVPMLDKLFQSLR
jgi:glycosyltransferase involved in cell wall biosynthesis